MFNRGIKDCAVKRDEKSDICARIFRLFEAVKIQSDVKATVPGFTHYDFIQKCVFYAFFLV